MDEPSALRSSPSRFFLLIPFPCLSKNHVCEPTISYRLGDVLKIGSCCWLVVDTLLLLLERLSVLVVSMLPARLALPVLHIHKLLAPQLQPA